MSVQPKPAASRNAPEKPAAYIISFFGTQPRITQVPPTRSPSTISTRAPCAAARREAATPPDPAPIVMRSYSVDIDVLLRLLRPVGLGGALSGRVIRF